MTQEEMGRVTLADFEAMAERFGLAVKTIKDAQAFLGGPPPAAAASPEPVYPPAGPGPGPLDPVAFAAQHRLRQLQPVEGRRPRLTDKDLDALTPAERQRAERGGNELTPSDVAERRRRMEQFEASQPVDDPNLPDEIRAMERGE